VTTPLVIATSNPAKVREIRAILDGVAVLLCSLDRWPDLRAPEETGSTFEENARQKALYYAARTGELVVAEDSGLEIDTLGGAPGVESARFGGSIGYPEKFRLIYDQLIASATDDRRARFVCALVLARGRDVLFETRGVVEGRIASAPRGGGGFGYDPIFFYPPFNATLAEVSADQKASVSHRGEAFRTLRAYLQRSRF
jgi:XTP/dITP diphosphohydrolase